MTRCVKGDHEFPDEDAKGAYCVEHGAVLLFRGDPITPEDFEPEFPQRIAPRALGPAGGEHPH